MDREEHTTKEKVGRLTEKQKQQTRTSLQRREVRARRAIAASCVYLQNGCETKRLFSFHREIKRRKNKLSDKECAGALTSLSARGANQQDEHAKPNERASTRLHDLHDRENIQNSACACARSAENMIAGQIERGRLRL